VTQAPGQAYKGNHAVPFLRASFAVRNSIKTAVDKWVRGTMGGICVSAAAISPDEIAGMSCNGMRARMPVPNNLSGERRRCICPTVSSVLSVSLPVLPVGASSRCPATRTPLRTTSACTLGAAAIVLATAACRVPRAESRHAGDMSSGAATSQDRRRPDHA
jgi:hypothetical protein